VEDTVLVASDPQKSPGLPEDSPAVGVKPEEQALVPGEFQRGIGHLAGGVTVVTTCDDAGGRVGVTSTSVCSLSMDPPTLVACIPRRSRLGRDIGRTQRFCVNILSSRQRDVAEAFSESGSAEAQGFRHGRWAAGVTGSPVLEDALASFECTIHLVQGYPEHLIVVGGVRSVTHTSEACDPLLYFAREFAELGHDEHVMADTN
jgi:flavin reductase (DIM6/NTAB) family NADH-FMN oxidoreductase RutF